MKTQTSFVQQAWTHQWVGDDWMSEPSQEWSSGFVTKPLPMTYALSSIVIGWDPVMWLCHMTRIPTPYPTHEVRGLGEIITLHKSSTPEKGLFWANFRVELGAKIKQRLFLTFWGSFSSKQVFFFFNLRPCHLAAQKTAKENGILLSVFLFYSAKETGIVATCGGNVVCLIDVKTGRVLKRLKQDREGGQVSSLIPHIFLCLLPFSATSHG